MSDSRTTENSSDSPLGNGNNAPNSCHESSSSSGQFSLQEERDEVKEIQKMSSKDTNRVKIWRLATTAVLFLTAFAVTYTTFRFLKREEKNNFEVAFEQFSRTVGDSALAQQRAIHEANVALASIITGYAQSSNATFPFVTVPLYEEYARNARLQAALEILVFAPFVEIGDREAYENYANEHVQEWVEEGHKIEGKGRLAAGMESYNPYITDYSTGLEVDLSNGPYCCVWQYSPPPSTYGLTNMNLNSIGDYAAIIPAIAQLQNETLITRVRNYASVPTAMTQEEHDAMHSRLANSDSQYPHSFAYHPVRRKVDDKSSDVVGVLVSGIAWDANLRFLLPRGVLGIHAVVKNTCGQSYTYEIDGPDAFFIGDGDLHELEFNYLEVMFDLTRGDGRLDTTPGHCEYFMYVYPSSKFKANYDENTPEVFAAIVASTFCAIAIVFYIYDAFVQKRNENLVTKAAQTNAVVTDFLPDHIRDRLLNEKQVAASAKKGNLKSYLNEGKNGASGQNEDVSRPLADLFLDTTVIYADISGFTAWSSVREPTQIFILLETLYQAFDEIAKKRRVFKVETVGDCYVAVVGLPNPRKDHAVAAARFSNAILKKTSILTKQLEVTLGPDTGDLGLKIGIHSGPVTAGVLRGERARFQLFGNTMNTCAAMEGASKRGRIHASKESAKAITDAGKGHWLKEREDKVTSKGNATLFLHTYWVLVSGEDAGSNRSGTASTDHDGELPSGTTSKFGDTLPGLDSKTCRLINWNVETMLTLIKQVVARRNASNASVSSSLKTKAVLDRKGMPIDEVKEIISLPEFDGRIARKQQNPDEVKIPQNIIAELHHFISVIATMYRQNQFHNFDHASHVVMSIIKLMSRIVAPTDLESEADSGDEKKKHKTLHDHTYGITSDPLTHLACAFSGLIHDVDHLGVPNMQLVKEKVPISSRYQNRSVAEQNSLDLSWDLLMQPRYKGLRKVLFPTAAEMARFRQLVVNSVMATDIADKELKNYRNARWDKAFKKGDDGKEQAVENIRDEVNRKATIVIEHLIQASDVSHTMQHWHVYRKYNRNLFMELYEAYLNGRAEKSPAEFWYKGELGFFDFYIIPLTKKLKECGVFGVSSDEYLNYALANREEWEACGEAVVAELIEEAQSTYGTVSVASGGGGRP